MGRGRAKAKQTKVARDLKYRTFDPDFNQLQRELHGDQSADSATDTTTDDEFVDHTDEYADYGDRGVTR